MDYRLSGCIEHTPGAAVGVPGLAYSLDQFTIGIRVTINEVALIYKVHATAYYFKNGKVTREGEQVSEMLRPMLRHHGEGDVDDFGPRDSVSG